MKSRAAEAALEVQAFAAVHRYRMGVIAEGRRRGLLLVSEAPSQQQPPLSDDCEVIQTADIGLILLEGPSGSGARLRWHPDSGWWLARAGADPHRSRYVPQDAAPCDREPPAPALIDWTIAELHRAEGS